MKTILYNRTFLLYLENVYGHLFIHDNPRWPTMCHKIKINTTPNPPNNITYPIIVPQYPMNCTVTFAGFTSILAQCQVKSPDFTALQKTNNVRGLQISGWVLLQRLWASTESISLYGLTTWQQLIEGTQTVPTLSNVMGHAFTFRESWFHK